MFNGKWILIIIPLVLNQKGIVGKQMHNNFLIKIVTPKEIYHDCLGQLEKIVLKIV